MSARTKKTAQQIVGLGGAFQQTSASQGPSAQAGQLRYASLEVWQGRGWHALGSVTIPPGASDMQQEAIWCGLIKSQRLPSDAIVREVGFDHGHHYVGKSHPFSYWLKFCGVT